MGPRFDESVKSNLTSCERHQQIVRLNLISPHTSVRITFTKIHFSARTSLVKVCEKKDCKTFKGRITTLLLLPSTQTHTHTHNDVCVNNKVLILEVLPACCHPHNTLT